MFNLTEKSVLTMASALIPYSKVLKVQVICQKLQHLQFTNSWGFYQPEPLIYIGLSSKLLARVQNAKIKVAVALGYRQ